jgi:hypothetical protein
MVYIGINFGKYLCSADGADKVDERGANLPLFVQ